jgi:purine-cytosine permease-like protein
LTDEPREEHCIDWWVYLWIVAVLLIVMALVGPEFLRILRQALSISPF